jgi:hypothetical protein
VDDVFYFGNDFHGYPDSCWRFRRGFVEIVAMPATAWLAHEKRLRVVHPIREVWLTQGMTPEEAGRSGGQNVYRIPGRKKKLPRRAGEEWADLLIRLFEAEFPGVRFHSPAEWERANGDHTF